MAPESSSSLHQAGSLRPWNNPESIGVNRLPARGTLLPYATGDDARAGAHPRILSLDGEWSFKVLARPEDTPADFASPKLDVGGWDTVAVPGNWTMQGHGRPQYTNVQMPFAPNDPPHPPADNPTGLYRTTFALPEEWRDQRIVFHLGAATSVATLWINGRAVGVAKDSRLPTEFDITRAVQRGTNTVAIQVVQWSDASYIEDQDQWWQAGIQRCVYLYATPRTYLADIAVRSDYEHDTVTGDLRAEVYVAELPGPGWKVVGTVHDAEGRRAYAHDIVDEPRLPTGDGPDLGIATLTARLRGASPWSAEVPTLYTLTVRLYDPAGAEVEATRTRVGFRTVTIAGGQLLVNGTPITIRGVNRHEHHDRFGSAVPPETMLTDIQVLKAYNVNAVRTAHYPPDPYFLQLADHYGLYVIDEANIESHANYSTLCDDPHYRAAFVDRVSRMVLRDRNHPCVIAWSLGNESGYGNNHDHAAEWVRRADPTRPLHYEGAIASDWSAGHKATDIVCPMYPSIDAIAEWASTTTNDRPLIMCEYAHAMGNSCGNLADYWETIANHPGLQGGFIWEMFDHGIATVTADGRGYWGYGGDFGDEPHDGNFVCDGLFWPDRTPHPAMLEAKHVLQPVAASLIGERELRITNSYDFRTFEHLRISYEITVDGEVVTSNTLAWLDLGPGESTVVRTHWKRPRLGPGQEAHVLLRFEDTTRTALLPAGHEIGWVQLPLGVGPPKQPSAQSEGAGGSTGNPPTTSADEDTWTIQGEHGELVVDQADGLIRSWRRDGVDLLRSGWWPTVWRAPTDNDGVRHEVAAGRHQHQALFGWLRAGLDRFGEEQIRVALYENDPAGARILREGRLSAEGYQHGIDYVVDMLVDRRGGLELTVRFMPDEQLPDLPRLGIQARLPAGFERVCWFGRGPHESYVDRRAGAAHGRWTSTVDEQYVPYIHPQEHGNKTDVRWIALRRDDGVGLLASAPIPIQAKASHYSDAMVGAAWHPTDLVRDDEVHFALDVAQRGLGGASCGPDTLEQYQVPAGRTYEYTVRLWPLAPHDDPGMLHRRLS